MKCMSAQRGVSNPALRSSLLILARFSASLTPWAVSLTSSPPASMMRMHWLTLATVSRVSVLVMLCTLTGRSPPNVRLPMLIISDLYLLILIMLSDCHHSPEQLPVDLPPSVRSIRHEIIPDSITGG